MKNEIFLNCVGSYGSRATSGLLAICWEPLQKKKIATNVQAF